MKTIHLIVPLLSACQLILGLNNPVLCQQEGHYSPGHNVRQGYWKLKTDYTIHGSQIGFYDSDSQLVYQESLPNQFIKLTKKNLRRLNKTLSRLTTNQLVASSISTSGLPYDVQKRSLPRYVPEVAASDPKIHAEQLAFRPQLFTPVGTAAVHLILTNPTLERLTIQILSAENALVYEHVTHLGDSRHHLDLWGMPAGTYQIQIKSTTQHYRQSITLAYGQRESVVLIDRQKTVPDGKLYVGHK